MASTSDTQNRTGCYIYGIVPGDVEADSQARGVGGSSITLVRHGDIAALVSEVGTDRPLGEPEDLQAHARVLDGAAAEVAVLPMRFGAVVGDPEAVAEELLAVHEEEFRQALDQLDGYAEYVVRGRYAEETILGEVLTESAEAAQLRDAIRDKPEDATRNERLALGELISNAVEAKRQADTRALVEALDRLGLRYTPRQPTHELEAVHVACLAEVAKQDELGTAMADLEQDWDGRVDIRILGPLAPYDFVTTTQPPG
jgi:hypothetical protein